MKRLYVIFAMLMLLIVAAPMALAENDTNVSLDTESELTACCMAMTAECLACTEGVSVDEYCDTNLDAIGCEVAVEVISDSQNVEVTQEDEEEIKIMVTPYGSEVRLDQLKSSIERNVEMGKAVLAENEFSNNSLIVLEGILADLTSLIDDIDNLNLDQESSVLAQEYVAIKKQAITLSQDFKQTVHKEVTEDKIDAIKKRVQERSKNKIEELKNKLQEKRKDYEHKKAVQVAERLGIELTGDENSKEIANEIQSQVKKMSEEKRAQAEERYKEAKAKEKVRIEAVKEQAKTQIQERYDQRREQLQENIRERIQNSEMNDAQKARIANQVRAQLDERKPLDRAKTGNAMADDTINDLVDGFEGMIDEMDNKSGEVDEE